MGTYNNFYKVNNTDLLDILHPIGSIFKTMDTNFDPSTVWGGTWEKITDKFLYGINSGSITTGGAASVTLGVSNLPSHNHSFTPSGSVTRSGDLSFSGTTATGSFYGGPSTDSYNTGCFSLGSGKLSSIIRGGSAIGYAQYEFSMRSSGKITKASFNFSGSAGDTGNTGSGTSFNISPPYQAVYIWKRTA